MNVQLTGPSTNGMVLVEINGMGLRSSRIGGDTHHLTFTRVRPACKDNQVKSIEKPPGPTVTTSPRVSVIIPALNESENLQFVLPRIPSGVHEIILVDDHCTDDTAEVAQRLLSSIRIVRNERIPGKGNALQAGFNAATGDILVALDADGSSAPEEIPLFVGALLAGADFAKGSRFIQGGGTSDMPWHRIWGNRVFVYSVRALFGGRYTDLCYGFNAFWSHILPVLQLDGDGFEIETMMNIRALRAGLKVSEVPSFESARVHGVGRLLTLPDGWRVLKTIWRERTMPPALATPPALRREGSWPRPGL